MLLWCWLGLTCWSILVSANGQVLLNLPLMDYLNATDANVLQDIEYGKEHPAQKLDVYLPPAGVAPGPATIVFIHGGAWRE
jgi:acetyl esterase/lipase